MNNSEGRTVWYVDFSKAEGAETPERVTHGSIGEYSVDTAGNETYMGITGLSGNLNYGPEIYQLIAQRFVEAAKQDETLSLRLNKKTPSWLQKLFFTYLQELAKSTAD